MKKIEDLWAKFRGFILFLTFYSFSVNRYKIGEIILRCLEQGIEKNVISKKMLILMVGFSKSGKSHLIENNEFLSKLFKVETNLIHQLLRKTFAPLEDETVGTPIYWLTQILTNVVKIGVMKQVFKNNLPAVIDTCNLTRRKRRSWINKAHLHGYKVIIVHVKASDETLLIRNSAAF